MTLPRPRTVRAKLTLFTMLVTGVLLGLIILVVDFGARRTLLGAVDAELLRQARGMSNGRIRGPGGMGGPRRSMDPGNPRMVDRRGDAGERRLLPPLGNEPSDEVRPLDFPAEPGGGAPRTLVYDAAALSLARRGTPSFSERELSGKIYRLYTFPIRRGDRIVQVNQIPLGLTSVYSSLDSLRATLLRVVLPVGVLFAGLASLVLVDRFMRPLRRISGEAERIGESELSSRLPVVGEDEFASLSTTLNGMLARLETAFQKERAEVERQKGFTADASHELKTPLAIIKANAGLILHLGGTPEERREWTTEIDSAANRMTRLVNDMLVLARAESGAARDVSAVDLRTVAEAARRQLSAGEDRLRLDLPSLPVTVLGSSEDLTRLAVNLAGNALTHSGTSSPVVIAVRSEGDQAILTVTDEGKGIEAEHLPHLFDRFYRVDASRSSGTGGTGLGLAIVKVIAEAHRGRLTVDSRPTLGTTFTATFPLNS